MFSIDYNWNFNLGQFELNTALYLVGSISSIQIDSLASDDGSIFGKQKNDDSRNLYRFNMTA